MMKPQLTKLQWAKVYSVRSARRTEKLTRDAAQVRLFRARAQLNRAVVDAINAGIPVAFLADQLGVTPGRVYQMRTEHERTNTEPKESTR